MKDSTPFEHIQAATPVPCGNPWESLPGDDQERFCGTCNRSVYNLSLLSNKAFETLQIQHPNRLCVVAAPPWRGFLLHPVLLGTFGLLVLLLFLCQGALAEETQEKSSVFPCKTHLFMPRIAYPQEHCLDDAGKPISVSDWMKDFYQKQTNPIPKNPSEAVPDPHPTQSP